MAKPRRKKLSALLLVLLLGSLALSGLILHRHLSAPTIHRGIALGLFAEDPSFSYEPLLREIAGTSASHVSLVIPYYQHDIHSTEIGPHPRFSPSDEVVERTLDQANEARLQVLLFPILRLEYAVTPDEWRGTLQPRDPETWWKNYEQFILTFARLAATHRLAALCIGSELGSLDIRQERWQPLIQKVRRIFRGKLVYSANWDHYEKVAIWPLVDLAGLSAYFQLSEGLRQPPLARLIHAWQGQRDRLGRWQAGVGKPLIFTELGYHSQDKTNAYPWDEAADRPINLQEQADCYEAFVEVWRNVPYFSGVYFWNWFGWGGPQSPEYCPRGKPAARVLCRWFGAGSCPLAFGMPWFNTER